MKIFKYFYWTVYAFFYAGWLCHRSMHPIFLQYSAGYLCFLAVLALGFLLPFAVQGYAGAICAASFRAFLKHLAVVAAVFYLLTGLRYYYTQSHPFDPYLQAFPERFDNLPKEKAPEVFRILCLGDSATAESGLKLEDRYPSIVARQLKALFPQRQIEVMNAGKAWYTSRHAIINYTTYYAAWQPDLVIVMQGMDDLMRSFSNPHAALGQYNDLWSHFYGPAIQGAKPPSFEADLWRRFLDLPGVRRMAEKWYSRYRFRERDWPVEKYVSLRAFSINMDRLLSVIENDGAKGMVVSQASLYADDLDANEKKVLRFQRECCLEEAGWGRYNYPSILSLKQAMQAFNRVSEGVARSAGVLFVDAAAGIPKDLNHFRDDIHYQPQGTERLASLIVRAIQEARLLA